MSEVFKLKLGGEAKEIIWVQRHNLCEQLVLDINICKDIKSIPKPKRGGWL